MRHYAFAPDPGSGLSNVVPVFMGNVSDTDAGGAHIRPGLMACSAHAKAASAKPGMRAASREYLPL